VPTQELNTLADILAQCVNLDGVSGGCSTLFTAASPSGGITPANTIDAMLNIAQNPVNNVGALYDSVTGPAPFQPSLGSVPNDWTATINYSDGSLDGPGSVAIDSPSYVWVANNGGASLSKFSSGGAISGSSGYTGAPASGYMSLPVSSQKSTTKPAPRRSKVAASPRSEP
jgi:hypothetical protein